jgi:hypothetical protein
MWQTPFAVGDERWPMQSVLLPAPEGSCATCPALEASPR